MEKICSPRSPKLNQMWKSLWPLWLIGLLALMAISEAHARAGRGRSFGGSRTLRQSSPNGNPPTMYHSPRNRPEMNHAQGSRPSFFKNIAGGIAGGFVGGLIGNMLFRSVTGHASPMSNGGGMTGGIGILEILLLAGLGFLLYRLFKSRPAFQQRAATSEVMGQSPVPNYPYSSSSYSGGSFGGSSDSQTDGHVIPFRGNWHEDENLHREKWLDIFFQVQTAWSRGDLRPISHLLSPEMQRYLQEQLDQLKQEGLRNVIDRIAIRQTEVTDEWSDNNREYVMVKFTANLLDYTLEEKSGKMVEGDQNTPVRFEEFWTFWREGMLGGLEWKLAGLEQI